MSFSVLHIKQDKLKLSEPCRDFLHEVSYIDNEY